MKRFTYVSLFAGIGGMTMGLKSLGGIGVAAFEYDPTEKRTQYAQEAHKLLHPLIPVYGDVCAANTDEMPDFDILCFTPPCQAFSVAGKRGGFEDTRGTLTFEALRIANVKRPKILFMENVKGLVNHDKGNTMSTIIHAINEIGYTVDFTVLNSKYFDVAQNRERVYLIGIRDDLITPEPWNDVKGTTMLPKAKRRYQEEGARTFNFDWPEQTEVRTRLRDFLEDSVDEKYYLSEDKTAKLVAQLSVEHQEKLMKEYDAMMTDDGPKHRLNVKESVTPPMRANGGGRTPGVWVIQEAQSGTRLRPESGTLRKGGVDHQHLIEGLPIREATKQGYSVAAEGDAVNIQFPNSKTRRGRVGKQMANTIEASGINQGVVEREESPIMLGHIDLKEHDAIKRVYSPTGQGPTLTTMGGGHREPKIAEEVRPCLTPFREEKRQNGPRFKEDGAEAHTITTIDRHGVAIGEYPRYRIRKLTPKECLRLQAVPEDAIRKLIETFSDSRCYKFAGNGLTTTVIRAIGKRLIKYL